MRFIFCGTTAIEALEELEEEEDERDLHNIAMLDFSNWTENYLGFGRDGLLLTLFSSSEEEEDEELLDLLPLLVVLVLLVTKAWLGNICDAYIIINIMISIIVDIDGLLVLNNLLSEAIKIKILSKKIKPGLLTTDCS